MEKEDKVMIADRDVRASIFGRSPLVRRAIGNKFKLSSFWIS